MNWTHEQLKALDGKFENWHYGLEDGDKYRLTLDELGWMDFVRGKYSIYDHIMENGSFDSDGRFWYTVDVYGMSEALRDDGMQHKAVCLSDDTSLQAVFFYSSMELEEEYDD